MKSKYHSLTPTTGEQVISSRIVHGDYSWYPTIIQLYSTVDVVVYVKIIDLADTDTAENPDDYEYFPLIKNVVYNFSCVEGTSQIYYKSEAIVGSGVVNVSLLSHIKTISA
jgi:serine/threonine-protein kinase RIO1